LAIAKRSVFRTFGALPKPFRRWLIRTIRPSWTAGSVAIVERDDGRWLFVQPVYRDGWTLPGGLVDRGEHPAVTAVREVKEELGLIVEVTGGGWVVVDPEHSRVETVFRVALADGVDPDGIEITTAELSAMGWFDPDDPPPLEDETFEVLALSRQVADGGASVRYRGDGG
jgi:ADP-ribose pyrophosphatase YjhB (NUDIX family)